MTIKPAIRSVWPPAPWRYEAWHRLRRPVVRVPGNVVHATSLAVPPPGLPPPPLGHVGDDDFISHLVLAGPGAGALGGS